MEHFSTTKHLPQTSAFASIKEGMPRVQGHGRVAGLQKLLEDSQTENQNLLARVEALEAQVGGGTIDVGDEDDGFGE
jgi:hypothetical protein